jgi:3'-phosphoadenosine 5'-phosphosulfate sulfotransferase (PAPS reductase)/FAD synthetase
MSTAPPPQLAEQPSVMRLVAEGALVAANHSGGKDSQALLSRVIALGVPREQLVVMHATLGDVEWEGAAELAERQAREAGVEFVLARAPKTFFELVEHRASLGVPAWPTSSNRQCTSDLKRDPIMRETRRVARERGRTVIVTAMGLRAEESSKRAKMATLKRSARGSTAGRAWWDWLPIHHFSTADVFRTIAGAGQRPHEAYALGNARLSCVFCFMGCAGDARNGAIRRPHLFRRYVEMEKRTGYTLHQSRKPLEVVAGITVSEAFEEHRRLRERVALPVIPA